MGKALLVIVLGFTVIFGGIMFNVTANHQRAARTLEGYYDGLIARYAAESIGNVAISRLLRDSTATLSSSFYGATFSTNLNDITGDSTVNAERKQLQVVTTNGGKSDTLRAILIKPAYSSYYYFTQHWHAWLTWGATDTIPGPVHGNDQIQVVNDPFFFGKVTTGDNDETNYSNAQFYGGMQLGTTIPMPTAADLQNVVASANLPLTFPNELWLRFTGPGGSFDYSFDAWFSFVSDNLANYDVIATVGNFDVHVEGQYNGNITVVSGNDLLIENSITRVDDSTDYLGLLAADDIVVRYLGGIVSIAVDGALLAVDRLELEDLLGVATLFSMRGSIVAAHDDVSIARNHTYDERLMLKTSPFFPRTDRFEVVYQHTDVPPDTDKPEAHDNLWGSPSMPKLIVKHKTEVVSRIELTAAQERFTVGSQDDNDLILQDASVATHHVRIEKHIENYHMVDLGSASGTTLNGRPVKNQMQLVDGDEISVGEHSIVFESETFGFGLRQYPSPEQLHDITATIDAISGPGSHLLDGVNTDTQTIAAEAPAEADYYEFEDLSENQQGADSTSSDDNGGAQAKTQYCLVAIHGPYTGNKYPLKFGDTKLGRDTTLNDIVIQRDAGGGIDPSISRRHATVRYHNGRFYVSDKRSKTRTYVNQIKLSTNERIPLLERDELEIVSDQTSTILRLLPDSEYDCAPPAKAGTWWIRNRLKTEAAVAVLFLALSLITLTSIMIANSKQRARPTELTFTPEVWYRPATTLAADGRTRAHLALADLNGDGSVDVVTSDATGNLLALDGPSKGELWQKNNTSVDPAIPITLADINTNGLSDILFAGQDGRLHALDGQSGAEMWVSPILGDLISPPAVGDFDRNGIRDVVMCTKSGRIFIAYNIIIAPEWHSLDTGTPVHSTPALADVDDDGIQEIFISDSGKLLVIRAAEAKIEVVTDLQATVRKIAGDHTTEHPIVMPPSFGDLNNNGVTDIIVAAASGHHLAIEGSNGRPIWHAYLPDQGVSRAWHLAQPLVGRFNDDDIPDVVMVAGNRVQVVTGTENKLHRKPIAWQQDLDEPATTVRQIVLADFDKDGNQDIVLAAEDNEIFILNGATGDFLARFRNTKGIEITSPLVIADLDGTGFLSILFCVPGHRIYRIRTSSPIARNGIVWAQAYHDARHSGTYDYAAPGSGSQYALAVVLACMSVMTGLLTTRAKRQRANLIYRNQNAG